jgi:hypothetical protein
VKVHFIYSNILKNQYISNSVEEADEANEKAEKPLKKKTRWEKK